MIFGYNYVVGEQCIVLLYYHFVCFLVYNHNQLFYNIDRK